MADGENESNVLFCHCRYGYGSIPINTISSGMNIHLPAILGFTRYQGFDPSPYATSCNHAAGVRLTTEALANGSTDLFLEETGWKLTGGLLGL